MEHARLSASGAQRWMACPGSIALEELFPETDTEFTREGTVAHALAEKLLSIYVKEGRKEYSDTEWSQDAEMNHAVQYYLDYIWGIEDLLALKGTFTEILVEKKVWFDHIVPGGFGTCDCIVVTENEIHIVDFKYGKGVEVDAKDNPQTRLYGLGALRLLDWIYDIKSVVTHIVQPRLRGTSSETLTANDITSWGENEVKPKALLADNNTREYNPGEHCRFCRARATCRARAQASVTALANLTTAKEEKEWLKLLN